MEAGNSRGPASFSLDPRVAVAPNDPGPLANIPAGGSPPGPPVAVGGQIQQAPGPAAVSLPQQPQPLAQPFNPMPSGVAELNQPGESVILTELQDVKNEVKRVVALNKLATTVLFALGCICIAYLTHKAGVKIKPVQAAS